jgi:uncharacterized protein (DUF488 family)
MLYTIGYERLTIEDLIHVQRWSQMPIVDVRSKPRGRVKRGFSADDLINVFGDTYIARTDLGGLAERDDWRLERIPRSGILLCQEEAPGDCHRHELLIHFGLNGRHIYRDELVLASELAASIREDRDYELCGELPSRI